MTQATQNLPTRALRKSSAWLLATFVLMGALLWTANASATVMRYADMSRLIEISDVIVHGKIVEQKSFFDQERGHILTNTTVEVKHAFFGEVSQTVRFQQWGGTYEDKISYIPGDARFEPGEEVVLFLRYGHPGDDRLYLSALSQAKYTVHRNQSGDALISRDLSDLSFVLPSDPTPVSGINERPTSEQSFYATLQSLVAGIKQIGVTPHGGVQ